MPDCDSCYDPACARSLNAAAPCNCTDFFNVVRLANNSYTNAVFNALPATAASITTGHLDALRGHSNVLQVAPMSPAAVTLYNGGAVLAATHDTRQWLRAPRAEPWPHLTWLHLVHHHPVEAGACSGL